MSEEKTEGKDEQEANVTQQSTGVTVRRLFYRKGGGVGVTLVEDKNAEGAAPYRVRAFIPESGTTDVVFNVVGAPPRPHEAAMRGARASAAVLREVADELERLAASVPESLDERCGG